MSLSGKTEESSSTVEVEEQLDNGGVGEVDMKAKQKESNQKECDINTWFFFFFFVYFLLSKALSTM